MEGILSDGKRVQSSADMETQTPWLVGVFIGDYYSHAAS